MMGMHRRTLDSKNDKYVSINNNPTGKEQHKTNSNSNRIGSNTHGSHYISHSVWCRIVTVASLAVIIYWINYGGYSSSYNRSTTMAKQSKRLETKRYQQFICAPSYKQEIQESGNSDCIPSKCGRVVMDGLLTDEESYELLELAKRGLALGGSSGGASILDLHSGALSKGTNFVNVYKLVPHAFSRQDFKVYNDVKTRVKLWLADHFNISHFSLNLTHPTFFSRLTSEPAATPHDEYWHLHVDKETYPAFHYTALVYLTDYRIDFEGGEFVFVDAYDNINRTIEPRVGRVSAFTSGLENKHLVKQVTSGARFALTIGFTCLKRYAIEDPGSKFSS